jgi:hypothetical protein
MLRVSVCVCCSAGHLDLFWHDVNQSVWIGGTDDKSGAGHERGPCKSPCPAAANTRPEHAIQRLSLDWLPA